MKKAQRLQKAPTTKRRKNRQRQRRIETEATQLLVSRQRKRMRADLAVTALRREIDGEIVIGVRKGLFGHPGTVILRVDDASLVGCVEDREELAKLVNNVGILAVSQLFNHNLAEGIEGLAKTIVRWAGIDLEALKAEAEQDAGPGPYQCQHCPETFQYADGYATHLELVHAAPVTVEVPSVDDITATEAPVL